MSRTTCKTGHSQGGKVVTALVGPSFVAFRSKIAPPVPFARNNRPLPMEIHQYIYICSSFLLFFFLSLPSPSKFSLHEFTTRFREKARRRRNANRSRIEFHRGGIRDPGSALTTSPSKSDKARSRSRAPQLFRSRGARPSWKRKVEKGRRRRRGERVHNVIRSLFIDSRQCTRIR